MRIVDVSDVKISFSGDECVKVSVYLIRVIEENALNHINWYGKANKVSHSSEAFVQYVKDKEEFYMETIKTLSSVGGHPLFYDDLIYRLEMIYKKNLEGALSNEPKNEYLTP